MCFFLGLVFHVVCLLKQPFSHCQEMIQQVYGFSLESMHSEAEEMLEQLQVAKSRFQKQLSSQDSDNTKNLNDKEKTMRMEHINTRLGTGKYFSVTKNDGSTLAFQVICKHPERRSYIQRICLLGEDVAQLCQTCFDEFGDIDFFNLWFVQPLFIQFGHCCLNWTKDWSGCFAINVCAASPDRLDSAECRQVDFLNHIQGVQSMNSFCLLMEIHTLTLLEVEDREHPASPHQFFFWLWTSGHSCRVHGGWFLVPGLLMNVLSMFYCDCAGTTEAGVGQFCGWACVWNWRHHFRCPRVSWQCKKKTSRQFHDEVVMVYWTALKNTKAQYLCYWQGLCSERLCDTIDSLPTTSSRNSSNAETRNDLQEPKWTFAAFIPGNCECYCDLQATESEGQNW